MADLSEPQLAALQRMAEVGASPELARMPHAARMAHARIYGLALSVAAPALLAEVRRLRARVAALEGALGPEAFEALGGRQGLLDVLRVLTDFCDNATVGCPEGTDEVITRLQRVLSAPS